MNPVRPTARSSQRGFVIIAVLWILVALSALATIFSVYLSNSARALGATDIGVERDALISASLELAAYQLLLADDKSRPAQGSFRFRLDNAEAQVTYTSEAARVDLNQASKELLDGLFEVLGVEPKAAGELADRIVGWRSQPKSNAAVGASFNATTSAASNGTVDEGALYLASGLTYAPRGAPFAHVNELSLVLGATPAIVERVLPFVTVFSKSPDIDVLVAPPEVIAALPGMTPQVLNDFLKKRSSLPRDQKAIAAALGPAKDGAGLPDSKVFRVQTTLRFGNGRRTSSEAVIALNGSGSKAGAKDAGAKDANTGDANSKDAGIKDSRDKEPYSILSWQDQVETLGRPLRQAGG
ncbi:MAG TPA: type II secretion system minor pseudopilin GspK [Bradyrhizobium sp.]|uniref:general secretion pathway protein GspK n=1 Tax=Bradyrhizobium sp. TaxID=376 RepID=UPI002D80BA77|nr:type II secretion system minor pseudopilin GspK [Bradyrhizobium sp.]HET7886504.1 type II secretion system minor pseudopilin GspK [Bradyrhizobium sp.]